MTIGYLENRIAKLEMEIQDLQEKHEALIEGVRYLRNEIAKTQAVDAGFTRHGHWIFGQTMGHSWIKCSECCVSQSGQTATFTYCPNCGAKMDEVKE